MKTPTINLSNDDALVLQQISESGEEDVMSLASGLGMHRGRIMAILNSLRRKGLITIERTAGEWWVQISQKGKELSTYVWPDMVMTAYR